MKFEQKKLMVGAAIASVLMIMTIANLSLFEKKESVYVNGRGIASVAPIKRDTLWEKKLAQKLSFVKSDGSAQLASSSVNSSVNSSVAGVLPSVEEKFRYEVLNGQYAVELNNGKLKKLEFQGNLKPIKIDHFELFKKAQLLLPTYTRAKLLKDKKNSGSSVYQLFNGIKKVGHVELHSTNDGSLHSMKVW